MKTSGATIRREKARGEMRTAILETARNLVETEGVQALSVRAIAREIGYSPAALYEYFPAKGDIYHALYLEGTGGLAERMRLALDAMPTDAPAEERMIALANAYRNCALERPELYRLAWVGDFPASSDSDCYETKNEAFQLLIDVAREGVASRKFSDAIPAEAIALACWATVHGMVLLEISGLIVHKLGTEQHGNVRDFDLFQSTLMMLGCGFMRR